MFLFLPRELPIYCESLAGFPFGEPFNILSALCFLIPGIYGLRACRTAAGWDWAIASLSVCSILTALTQLVIHGSRPPNAATLDQLPTAAFAFVLLVGIGYRLLQFTLITALLNLVGFILLVLSYRQLLPYTVLGEVAGLAPPITALVVLGGLVLGQGFEEEETAQRAGNKDLLPYAKALQRGGWLIVSGGVLVGLALLARGLEAQACATIPIGLHWLSHAFGAAAMLVVIMAFVGESRNRQS